MEGCGRRIVARDVCHSHYVQLRKRGKLALLTAEDRLWRQVDKSAPGGCWLWTGKLNHDGYVRVRFKNKAHYGHRLIYELVVGAIPEGREP